MPTGYSYNLGTPGGVAVGKKTRKLYAFTPRFDPATRDFIMRDSNFEAGDPAVELVLMTLSTPKGTYLPDPTLGPDYEILTLQSSKVAVMWKASVNEALRRFVPSRITDIKVEVDPPRNGRLVFSVEFVDPRAESKLPVKLPLTLSSI
jgi:hypothetical protein